MHRWCHLSTGVLIVVSWKRAFAYSAVIVGYPWAVIAGATWLAVNMNWLGAFAYFGALLIPPVLYVVKGDLRD